MFKSVQDYIISSYVIFYGKNIQKSLLMRYIAYNFYMLLPTVYIRTSCTYVTVSLYPLINLFLPSLPLFPGLWSPYAILNLYDINFFRFHI